MLIVLLLVISGHCGSHRLIFACVRICQPETNKKLILKLLQIHVFRILATNMHYVQNDTIRRIFSMIINSSVSICNYSSKTYCIAHLFRLVNIGVHLFSLFFTNKKPFRLLCIGAMLIKVWFTAVPLHFPPTAVHTCLLGNPSTSYIALLTQLIIDEWGHIGEPAISFSSDVSQ